MHLAYFESIPYFSRHDVNTYNNFIQSNTGSTPHGSSHADAVRIVAQHQHAGTVGQHRVVMVGDVAAAFRALPREILGGSETVVSLNQP